MNGFFLEFKSNHPRKKVDVVMTVHPLGLQILGAGKRSSKQVIPLALACGSLATTSEKCLLLNTISKKQSFIPPKT